LPLLVNRNNPVLRRQKPSQESAEAKLFSCLTCYLFDSNRTELNKRDVINNSVDLNSSCGALALAAAEAVALALIRDAAYVVRLVDVENLLGAHGHACAAGGAEALVYDYCPVHCISSFDMSHMIAMQQVLRNDSSHKTVVNSEKYLKKAF